MLLVLHVLSCPSKAVVQTANLDDGNDGGVIFELREIVYSRCAAHRAGDGGRG